MENWSEWTSWNAVTILLVILIIVSFIQGLRKGAFASFQHLIAFVMEGLTMVGALVISWLVGEWLSPIVKQWLTDQAIQVPDVSDEPFKQLYYTLVTGIRDFTLLRFGILWLLVYMVVKPLLVLLAQLLLPTPGPGRTESSAETSPWLNRVTGGAVGSMIGAGRVLMLLAVMFVYASLFPHSGVTAYMQDSVIYREGSQRIFQPITGNLLQEKLPVFTRAVEDEFANILQRRYEIIDSHIPKNIEAVAFEITVELDTDEKKARDLYNWVGSRIVYDWEKVRLYEDEGVWKEQTPEDTFQTRLGVCIDYSRLYAVMARSVGLEVKVVTGLGYDGRGGYGPHAWNVVYLSEQDRWVPLDATWATSGDWFDPPNFEETHIPDV